MIFHRTINSFLQKIIDSKGSVHIFSPNSNELFLGIKGLKISCKKLFFDKISENRKHRKGLIYELFRYMYYVYIESYLIVINSKYIIPFIDKCSRLARSSKNCRQFSFISIQNGARLSYASTPKSTYHCQHLFYFGKHEINMFPKMEYYAENFYPLGSLVSSLYFNSNLNNNKEKYDLLIVSCWRGNIGFPKDVKETMRSMKIMDELLAKYINSRNIKAALILRSEENNQHWYMPEIGMNEYDYFKNIYGDSTDLIMNDFSERPIYKLIQQSHMVVSVLSTALVEAFGFGKKALFYNFVKPMSITRILIKLLNQRIRIIKYLIQNLMAYLICRIRNIL